jgi:hypothetical protein
MSASESLAGSLSLGLEASLLFDKSFLDDIPMKKKTWALLE